MTEESLEIRAKRLLKWRITGKGETPNPFAYPDKIYEEIQYLIQKNYILEKGETPKSFRYEETNEGRKFASS